MVLKCYNSLLHLIIVSIPKRTPFWPEYLPSNGKKSLNRNWRTNLPSYESQHLMLLLSFH